MDIQTIGAVVGIIAFVVVVYWFTFRGRAENLGQLKETLENERARGDKYVKLYAIEKGKSKRRESEEWCAKNRPPKLGGKVMTLIATFVVSISIWVAGALATRKISSIVRERNQMRVNVAELSVSNTNLEEEKQDLDKKLSEVEAEKSRLLSRILDWRNTRQSSNHA
jgi:hypothetical protein